MLYRILPVDVHSDLRGTLERVDPPASPPIKETNSPELLACASAEQRHRLPCEISWSGSASLAWCPTCASEQSSSNSKSNTAPNRSRSTNLTNDSCWKTPDVCDHSSISSCGPWTKRGSSTFSFSFGCWRALPDL